MRCRFTCFLALGGGLLLASRAFGQAEPRSLDPGLTGGDYERGRALFHGEKAKCAACHWLRGEGGGTASDLTGLRRPDPAFRLDDSPGKSLVSNPAGADFAARMRDSHRRAGVAETLDESAMRDLLVFSLYDPPARSPAEITAVLGSPARREGPSENSPKPLNIVLVASRQDHGPGQHDYPAWQRKWAPLLRRAAKVTVSEAWEWPSPEQWGAADVVVLYFWNHQWSAERYRQLDEYQARGGGLALFHAATIADLQPEALARRIGLAAQPGPTKYRHTPFLLNFVAPPGHPVSFGFQRLNLIDEPFWFMFGDTNQIEVLATADMEGRARPLIWTFHKGKGRVFASIPGHYTWTWEDPLFRALALRGVSWAAGREPSRLEIRD